MMESFSTSRGYTRLYVDSCSQKDAHDQSSVANLSETFLYDLKRLEQHLLVSLLTLETRSDDQDHASASAVKMIQT